MQEQMRRFSYIWSILLPTDMYIIFASLNTLYSAIQYLVAVVHKYTSTPSTLQYGLEETIVSP